MPNGKLRSSPADPGRTAGPYFFGTYLQRAGDHNQRVTLYAQLSEKGFRVASPRGLTRLEPEVGAGVDA